MFIAEVVGGRGGRGWKAGTWFRLAEGSCLAKSINAETRGVQVMDVR